MIIELPKQITVPVVLDVPAYYKDKTCALWYAILEDQSLVSVGTKMVHVERTGDAFHLTNIQEVLTKCLPISEEDFLKEYTKVVNTFQEMLKPVAV